MEVEATMIREGTVFIVWFIPEMYGIVDRGSKDVTRMLLLMQSVYVCTVNVREEKEQMLLLSMALFACGRRSRQQCATGIGAVCTVIWAQTLSIVWRTGETKSFRVSVSAVRFFVLVRTLFRVCLAL
jgi:hypothetical protein